MEDRELIESLKRNMKMSRNEEINPSPFQMYRGDSALGVAPKLYLASDSPTYGWLDDLVRNTRSSLQQALVMMKEPAPYQKYTFIHGKP